MNKCDLFTPCSEASVRSVPSCRFNREQTGRTRPFKRGEQCGWADCITVCCGVIHTKPSGWGENAGAHQVTLRGTQQVHPRIVRDASGKQAAAVESAMRLHEVTG
jgi:hypothetical protein